MSNIPSLTLLITLVTACIAPAMGLEYGTPEDPANWRGQQGSGRHPAQDLVTSCSEQTNIVWRTALPTMGCSSPVAVGQHVFVLVDPHAASDAPELICIDITKGGIRWQQPVDNLDARPASEQQQAKALRKEELRLNRLARQLMYRHRQAKDGAAKTAIVDEAKAAGVYGGEKKGKPVWLIKPGDRPKGNKRYADYKKLTSNGWFIYEGWHYPGSIFTGQSMPSVVSDGTSVWAFTNLDAVACFDIASGERTWVADIRSGFNEERVTDHAGGPIMTASPRLVSDTLVVYSHHSKGGLAAGLDAASGEERWRQSFKEGGAYSPGSMPVHLRLGDTDVVYVTSGHVIRVDDGKILGKVEHPEQERSHGTYFGNHGCSAALGKRLMILHGGNGGGADRAKGGVYAFDLELNGEQLQISPAWDVRGGGENNTSLILLDGKCYTGDLSRVIDIANGAVTKLAFPHRVSLSGHGPIYADGKFVTVGKNDKLHKIKFDEGEIPQGVLKWIDAKSLKLLGEARLDVAKPESEVLQARIDRVGQDWWHWGPASPIAYGNRLFVRSHDAVYCIGDPQKAFAPPK